MNHHGASPDHAQGADVAAGHDGCPDADEGSAANGHLAAQMHPRGNVRVRSDVIMMVGSASRIQDDVSTDRAPGLIMAPAQIMLPGPISTSGATMALGWRHHEAFCWYSVSNRRWRVRLSPIATMTASCAMVDTWSIVPRTGRVRNSLAAPDYHLSSQWAAQRHSARAPAVKCQQQPGRGPCSDDEHPAHLRLSPINSSAVACPGWLIPSHLSTFQAVSARIFRSSHND